MAFSQHNLLRKKQKKKQSKPCKNRRRQLLTGWLDGTLLEGHTQIRSYVTLTLTRILTNEKVLPKLQEIKVEE